MPQPDKNPCCPDPADLRNFRLDSSQGTPFNYVVPPGRVLIINLVIFGRASSGETMKMRRNTELIIERPAFSEIGNFVNVVFPTGVPFFAGDTFTLDLSNNNGPMFAYGYERDA